jgi:hypothetical protein
MKNKELNVFNLNQVHKALFTKYISFIKAKQLIFTKEISSYVDDFKQDKYKYIYY